MSKAEKRACQYTGYCRNQSYSDFLNGYQQAEKDLALTWEDIKIIDKLLNQCVDCSNPYQEVLNRFNKQKEE